VSGAKALNLFGKNPRPTRRHDGVLASQEIEELIGNGKILSNPAISDDQIQPASIDLRLGNVGYRVRASFLPNRKALLEPKVREFLVEEIDLSSPALLDTRNVYIIPLIESLALPPDMRAKANPKSTTGRLDIFTRLMTDAAAAFEEVPQGYHGNLYVEVVPRTFSIIVRAGTKLNQLRFFRGNPLADDEELRELARRGQLVYYKNGGASIAPTIRNGSARLSIDLCDGRGTVIAYKARKERPPIDLAKVGAFDAAEFWEPTWGRSTPSTIIIEPGEFYLLASKEWVGVPPKWAAEMEAYDPSIGEFTVHYAGFFDPGFGFGESGEIKGAKAVLEVRAHEVPILLEDGQQVGRLNYLKMAERPKKLYGQVIGSSYQQQGLSLPKQFDNSAATLAPSIVAAHN
jgi:dCTP deaminase